MSNVRCNVEIRDPKGLTVFPWKGKPSQERLSAYIAEYLKSFEFGGERHYIVKARGYKPMVLSARVVTVQTGKVVAEWVGSQVHIAPTRIPPSPTP